MPFDAMFLTAVAAELRPTLVGARVDKVQQPARDTVVLQLRGRDGGGRLLLSANGNRPRVHLTQAQLENPAQPPMFCMLLRKHLAGGRLAGIRQPAAERMLDLTFDCTDELGVPCRKHLILELVGRNSNLILTGPDGRILDCLRRVDFEMSELRQLLPGLFYHEPPRQDRRIPQETTEAELLALLARPDAAMRLDKWLLAHFAGLSPLIARELSFRFAGETDAPIPTLDAARLAAFLTAEFAALPPVQMQPMLLWKDGAPTDFTYRDIRQYGGYLRAEPCESFSALLDRFYTETDHAERMRQRSQTLRKAISNLHERTRRKLELQRQELEATHDREQLRRQGSLLMATTHYAELKVYALETPGVVNASCEFNVETLMPTYKLSVGVPGKSNAFLISAKLGIPQEIIDAARNHMSNDDKRLDSVLSQLDDLKVQLKDAQAEAEQARYEAEHALESAEKKRDDLIKKGEEELENARRQAHDLMQQVQNEAYSLTDELRRIQKDEKTSAAQRAVRAREIARRDTETLLKKTDAKPQPVKEFVPLKEVQIGQEVVIADLGQTATVTARPDRNGMVEVRAGIMKTKVPLTNLRAPDKMEKRKPAEPRRSTRVQLDKSRKTSMELNLLGYTVDEALNEVDKFLDSGMLRGQSTLYIIHGNGTGALRTAIQKHLRTHKAVKSFRLGRYGEGESGVTVVELK